jgi:ABC-2 type transport system ATP-binding protein
LDRVNLTDRRDKRIGSLSHGMRRRVAVATALLGDPELVLLDEPTAGLDPLQARSLRDELLKRPVGQTIVVSSHNLDELERICDWVVMIDGGRCLRQGTLSDVTGRTSTAHWTLGPGEVPLAALQARLPAHQLALKDGVLVHQAPSEADLDPGAVVIASALAAAGVPIREVRRGVSLEARFFEGASKG